ncbi:MAG: LysM peptidoglycan-binding domain-containing protein [Anaerolineaceae bacterium]
MAILMILGLILMAFNPLAAKASGGLDTPTYVSPYNVTATPSADGAIYHTVLEGQVPYSIAALYGIDVNTLLANNNLESTSIINIGDILLIRNANERLPGEVVLSPTPAAGGLTAGTPQAGTADTADTVGSLGGGTNSTAVAGSSGLGSGTNQDLGATTEGFDLEGAMASDVESAGGVDSSYEQVRARMIEQFSQSGALVNLSGTPVPPELAMNASLNGEAYILLPEGVAGLRTATAVSQEGVAVVKIGEQQALAIPAVQAVALAPDAVKLPKDAEVTPNLIDRIFSDNTKYLALAVILMVLIGLLLLVISTRRLKQ